MHENTKAGLLRLENFIEDYGDGLPALNAEVSHYQPQIHIHIHDAAHLEPAHAALGSPTWEVNDSGRSAETIIDGVDVVIYYGHVIDDAAAQGPLRQLGLVKGLVAL